MEAAQALPLHDAVIGVLSHTQGNGVPALIWGVHVG